MSNFEGNNFSSPSGGGGGGYDHSLSTPRTSQQKRVRLSKDSIGTSRLDSCSTGNEESESGSSRQVNPFNSYLLQSLCTSVWSPSVMEITETPEEKKKIWSIDQVSILFPSRIEESPSTHQNEEEFDPEIEEKAQSAIEKFFDQPLGVVPSPIFTSSPIVRRSYLASQVTNGRDEEVQRETRHSWTNTELSFPPNALSHDLATSLSRFKIPEPLSVSIISDENMDTSSCFPRKLDFSFELSGSDEENKENGHDLLLLSPNANMNQGSVIFSPDVLSSTLDHMRSEMSSNIESPDATPIKRSSVTYAERAASIRKNL